MGINRSRFIPAVFITALLLLCLALYFLLGFGTVPALDLAKGVLIDPGHGGADVGAVAPGSGIYEAEVNLSMAYALKAALNEQGVEPVTLTRIDGDALGPTKDEDMEERARIIRESEAAAIVSIHMNSFTDPAVWGPQVFYDADSPGGKRLAYAIQKRLNDATGGSRRPQTQRLIVLRAANVPAVLVECGFLTNPEEDKKLQDPEYQALISRAVAQGVLDCAG